MNDEGKYTWLVNGLRPREMLCIQAWFPDGIVVSFHEILGKWEKSCVLAGSYAWLGADPGLWQ
jgi:hypothetical protein